MYKKTIKTKVKEEHICSGCIKGFDAKDIFSAMVPDREYSTNYCAKCLKELGITEFTPYLKPRKTRAKKVVDTDTVKTKIGRAHV